MNVLVATETDAYVHYFGPGSQGYTLCGLEAEVGDRDIGISPPQPVRAQVNCPQCIQIVRYCKALRLPSRSGPPGKKHE